MSEIEELPPSRLGTKEHWDKVYEREVQNFEDAGSEGEVWFGEESVSEMRAWASKHLPSTPTPLRIMECGSGNGTLLLSFLTSPASSGPQRFHLTGIDYSPAAAVLARGVEAKRREEIPDELDDDDEVMNEVECDWRTEDLLRKDFDGETWDLVLDKGTWDALCLSDERIDGKTPSVLYPERVAKLVRPGGFFFITSCNFTVDEVKQRWGRSDLGFVFHSSIPHKTFTFGGKQGQTTSTVAFRKVDSAPPANGHVNGVVNGHSDLGSLYLCVDCGGTKTDVAIADGSGKLVARAIGGTSNMAEVGLQTSYEIICATVLDALSTLHCVSAEPNGRINGGPSPCPVHFDDVWVGISGCDTSLDQQNMLDLLSPFFGTAKVSVVNDAHLLGGALLTHHAPWGIAVIAGTGSVVIALEVAGQGEVVQVGRRGGTGYLLGDDGSAFDLGRCAIRSAIDDFDAGEERAGGLAEVIRHHFEVKETGEVLAKVYDLDPKLSPIDATNVRKLRVSSLSRPILSYFSSGDSLAIRAVYTAAGLLVASIVSLVRQLLEADANRRLEDGAIVMGGGVIQQEAYRDVVLELLKKEGIVFGVVEQVGDVAGEGVMGLVEKAKKTAA
ncbi:hypothetical protein BCR39DRAFT_532226 [Naematelia encephala]|uniref:Protein-lysine N-methyltransferase EFM4 n=1 Tax=Naematelia encephala TaxID=71784 RepID=A0A1Y2B3A4_9TREE|nr:hypothetical protein BCR39DRAFT_532226 [Naematelia encephala]